MKRNEIIKTSNEASVKATEKIVAPFKAVIQSILEQAIQKSEIPKSINLDDELKLYSVKNTDENTPQILHVNLLLGGN